MTSPSTTATSEASTMNSLAGRSKSNLFAKCKKRKCIKAHAIHGSSLPKNKASRSYIYLASQTPFALAKSSRQIRGPKLHSPARFLLATLEKDITTAVAAKTFRHVRFSGRSSTFRTSPSNINYHNVGVAQEYFWLFEEHIV